MGQQLLLRVCFMFASLSVIFLGVCLICGGDYGVVPGALWLAVCSLLGNKGEYQLTPVL